MCRPFYNVMGCPISYVCITYNKSSCKCLIFYVASSVVPLLQYQRLFHQVMIASHTLHGITQSIHLCKVMICSSQTPPFPFLKVTHFPKYNCIISSTLHNISIYSIQKGVKFSCRLVAFVVPFLQGHGVYPFYKGHGMLH